MSTSIAVEEEPEKKQEEVMEVDTSPVKIAIAGTGTGSSNEDSSKVELDTNGCIEVDVETTSPKKPETAQTEEKLGNTDASNTVQQNNIHKNNSNNNSNNQSAKQNSVEPKIETNTAKETSPPPPTAIDEKKEEVVVNKIEQTVKAEPKPTPENSQQESVNVLQAPIDNHKEKESKKEAATIEAEKNAGGKQGLPKWMVQSANAPPSPSPEATEKTEEKQEMTAATPAKGRGRGRRSAAQKAADAAATACQQSSTSADDKQTDNSILHRPRRSTRTRVDYANPDPMTVVAEADDEEPGAAKRGSAAQAAVGRKSVGGARRGRKPKVAVATSGEDDEEREEDDDDEEYGSKKKTKKRNSGAAAKKAGTSPVIATGKRRGRPAGSGNKGKTAEKFGRGRPVVGGRRKRKADHDSDDEHGEVVYDDQESEKETTGDESAEEGKFPIQEVKKSAPIRAPPASKTASVANKPSPKKRGRPPAKGKQSKIPAPIPTDDVVAAEQTDESAVGGSGGDELMASETAQA